MRIWFHNISWDIIIQTNKAACEKGRSQHGISPSQSPKMQKLWESHTEKKMTLIEMVELCRRMHIGAPFLNFNGNTFAALAVEAAQEIKHPNSFLLEDAICNAITETLSQTGKQLLQESSDLLEQQSTKIKPANPQIDDLI